MPNAEKSLAKKATRLLSYIFLLGLMSNLAYGTVEQQQRQLEKLNKAVTSVKSTPEWSSLIHLPPNYNSIPKYLCYITLPSVCVAYAYWKWRGTSKDSLLVAAYSIYRLRNAIKKNYGADKAKPEFTELTRYAHTMLVNEQNEILKILLKQNMPKNIALLIMEYENYGEQRAAQTITTLNRLMWHDSNIYSLHYRKLHYLHSHISALQTKFPKDISFLILEHTDSKFTPLIKDDGLKEMLDRYIIHDQVTLFPLELHNLFEKLAWDHTHGDFDFDLNLHIRDGDPEKPNYRFGILSPVLRFEGGAKAMDFYQQWRDEFIPLFTPNTFRELVTQRHTSQTQDIEMWDVETVNYFDTEEMDDTFTDIFITIESWAQKLYQWWR